MAVDEGCESSIRFDLFELNPRSCQLRRSGVVVDLPPQALKILCLLGRRPNQLVTRKEIKEILWPDESHGDFDSRLNFSIKKLREALGDSAEAPRYIQTVRNAGYIFIAPLRESPVQETRIPASRTESFLTRAGSTDFPVAFLEHEPKRPSLLKPLLVGFGLGMAFLGLAEWVLSVHEKPVIKNVSAIKAEQMQQIRIGLAITRNFTGSGLTRLISQSLMTRPVGQLGG